MASRYADIPALNHIITILIDATRLYRRALAMAKDGPGAGAIGKTLDERVAMLADMQARVRDIGGKASTDGSMLGAAHKAFLDVRAVFDRDLNAALAEVERGEAYLRDEIRKCMRRDDISAETRAYLGVALDRAVTGEMRIEGKREQAQHEHRAH